MPSVSLQVARVSVSRGSYGFRRYRLLPSEFDGYGKSTLLKLSSFERSCQNDRIDLSGLLSPIREAPDVKPYGQKLGPVSGRLPAARIVQLKPRHVGRQVDSSVHYRMVFVKPQHKECVFVANTEYAATLVCPHSPNVSYLLQPTRANTWISECVYGVSRWI